ncbi:hypothetical protein HPB48_010724 [Haemaphysalis longicornis]|uniref:Uncharacterized protein n=1 Tax=Haemaphysalis longicornis TaxID=44386 RepID=A0A9J6G5U3_HAELO|nr:hypothetical protein HPB48_010724 [Haemaphysalis longicornis]
MVQHRMAVARRRTGDQGNQRPQHLKTTSHRRRKGTQEDQDQKKKKNKDQQIRSVEPPPYEEHSPESTQQANSKKASQLQGETKHPGQPPSQEERTRAGGADPRNVSRGELV